MVLMLALVVASASFTVSAAVGLGGSLVLVPAMSMVLGVKQGIAVSAVLLGCNNVAKVVAYRSTIPWRASLAVLALTIVGTAIGAQLLIALPERLVSVCLIMSIVTVLVMERGGLKRLQRVSAPALALAAGATSGFAGTSGPLKGIALRNLGFDRLHFVGAASAVSLAGDVMKTAIFAEARLLDSTAWTILAAAIPLMFVATLVGRRINRSVGERVFAGLFWAVMAGYSVRLVLAW